jgi:hypothetical protein
MAKKAPRWPRTLPQAVKWTAVGVLGAAGLYSLFVVVVILGGMLGLWPLTLSDH